ncbi:hypothetical protein EDD85DRAFT_797677 [Armillaria nabsnona]|nr:hypothetical protein EDD85DRAFT_797677 [Armillaria nabsnona]
MVDAPGSAPGTKFNHLATASVDAVEEGIGTDLTSSHLRQRYVEICSTCDKKDGLQAERRCYVPSQDKFTDSTNRPLVFRYSFGISFQQLLDYALHHHVVEVPKNPESDDPADIRGGLLVQRVCRMLKNVDPISLDYDVVIELYPNWGSEVIRIVGEELCCPGASMWYWDCSRSCTNLISIKCFVSTGKGINSRSITHHPVLSPECGTQRGVKEFPDDHFHRDGFSRKYFQSRHGR